MDNFEGVLPGSIVEVNLAGNYKRPHLARVNQVTETFFQFAVAKKEVTRETGCLDVADLRLKF